MNASEQLVTVTKDLDTSSATTLRAVFEGMFNQVDEWAARAQAIVVTSEDQRHEMKMARESRLALREIRVKADHARKKLKEDSLRTGRAIDGIANVLKALIEPLEEHLLVQETFAERAESGRRNALREARTSALVALGADAAVFGDLATMTLEQWSSTQAMALAARDAKVEAARHVEAVRLEAIRIEAGKRDDERIAAVRAEAERVERERVAREENERLRAEAAERDRAAKVERERVDAERAAERAKAKAEVDVAKREAERALERLEAEATAGRRLLAERDAEIAKERAERERIELEAKAAESVRAEAKRVADIEAERLMVVPPAPKVPAWAPPDEPPRFLPDERNAVLNVAHNECVAVFQKHGLEFHESLMVVARLGGQLQAMCAALGEVGTSIDDMHGEFAARVAKEREEMVAQLAAKNEGTMS